MDNIDILFAEFWKTKEVEYRKIQNDDNFYSHLDKETEIVSYVSDVLLEFFTKHNVTKLDKSIISYIVILGQEIDRENRK